MNQLLCLFLCLALCLVCVTGLRCLPSEGCTSRVTAGMDCKFGFLLGPCRKCECAKGPGEGCGGPWRLWGTCAEGLVCEKDPKDRKSKCRPRKSCLKEDKKEADERAPEVG
ncbi:single insulin-like growth factor-binding domain protein-2 [Penaeus vannamei]|uniref:single insulin-like growth factor-binding domain protein-2 n=1 Tax=Penaeus vannamei TaxID=6689 RepID=UPI00387F6C9A